MGKRIYADVSEELGNRFLATAKLMGTTGQALIEGWARSYAAGEKHPIVEDTDDLILSLLHSSHPTAAALMRVAIQAAGELVNAGQHMQGQSETADIAGAIKDAERIAAEARRATETGEPPRGKGTLRVGGRKHH